MLMAPRFGEQMVCLFQLLEVGKGAEIIVHIQHAVMLYHAVSCCRRRVSAPL